jgi:acyl-coenzyme A synthetase/AMP-(fatty) acid ligase
VRPGNCVATPRTDGGYVIVAEPRGTPAGAELGDAAAWIRRELSRRFDAAPAVVAFIARGALPKTPSGKIARRRTASLFEAGELEQLSRAG